MLNFPRIPAAAARKLGYYVYVYVNPLDSKIFYVGKGKGSRALAHVDVKEKKAVARLIRSIRVAGKEPGIDILAPALRERLRHRLRCRLDRPAGALKAAGAAPPDRPAAAA